MPLFPPPSIIDSLKPTICILDNAGKIIAVNKSWVAFGKQNGLSLPKSGLYYNYIEISESSTGEDAVVGKNVALGIKRVLSGSLNEFSIEYPCHSPFVKRWFNVTITPLVDKDVTGAVVAHTDITKRIVAEESFKRRFNEVNYYKLALVESSMVVMTDGKGAITYLNNNFCKVSGYFLSELLGQDLGILNSGFHTKLFIGKMWNTIRGGRIWKGEFRNKTKRNQIFWIDTTIIPFKDEEGNVFQYVAVSQDITIRKKSLSEQESLNEHLRLLTSHLQTVREHERRKFAREIHDELGQQLSVLKIELNLILQKADNDPEGIKRKAVFGIDLINDLIKSVKRIIGDLKPGPLEDLGLDSAIEFLVKDFSKRTGIATFYVSKKLRHDYPADIGLAVYRICQESLTNASMHSQANKVWITLYEENGKLIVKIKDNGIGIKKENMHKANSFGILGMKERVRILGGSFRLQTAPDKGTRLSVIIPLPV